MGSSFHVFFNTHKVLTAVLVLGGVGCAGLPTSCLSGEI